MYLSEINESYVHVVKGFVHFRCDVAHPLKVSDVVSY